MSHAFANAYTGEWLAFSALSATAITGGKNPAAVCHARNPFLIPNALILEIQNMDDFRPIVVYFKRCQISKALDVWLSDAFVKQQLRLRHAATLRR